MTPHPRRDFGVVWAGQAVSGVGTAVTSLALPLLALTQLHVAGWQVGLLTACTYAAYSVLALPVGAWLDRRSRRPLVIAGDLGRCLVLAVIPLMFWSGGLTYGYLVAATLLTGALAVVFDVAYWSWLPSLVPSSELVRANGWLGATDAAGRLAGPGIAGALIAVTGAAVTIGIDAISFGLAAAATLLVRTRETRPTPADAAEGTMSSVRGLGAARDGLAVIRRTPLLVGIIAATSWANLFVAVWLSAEVVFLVQQLHASSATAGLALALGSGGGIIGGLLAAGIASRLGTRTTLLAMAAVSGPFALVAPSLTAVLGPWSVAVGLFGVTLTNAVSAATAVAYRQQAVPATALARVTATARVSSYAVLPLGALLGAALLGIVSPRVVLIIAAVGYGLQWMFLITGRPARTPAPIPSA